MPLQQQTYEKLPATYLRREFLRRKKRNPQYSLRAFASFLNIPSGRLSEILSGKRKLSAALTRNIIDRLKMSHKERASFLGAAKGKELLPLIETEFEVVSDPVHFALLTLMETDGFRSEESWIAKRLGVHVEETREILGRLKALQLIEKKEEGWQLGQAGLTTTQDIPSAVLRESHKIQIEQAADSLEKVSTSARDITSIYLAVDPDDLPAIKEKIRKFRRSLLSYTKGRPKKEVYALQIQFFPLTKP